MYGELNKLVDIAIIFSFLSFSVFNLSVLFTIALCKLFAKYNRTDPRNISQFIASKCCLFLDFVFHLKFNDSIAGKLFFICYLLFTLCVFVSDKLMIKKSSAYVAASSAMVRNESNWATYYNNNNNDNENHSNFAYKMGLCSIWLQFKWEGWKGEKQLNRSKITWKWLSTIKNELTLIYSNPICGSSIGPKEFSIIIFQKVCFCCFLLPFSFDPKHYIHLICKLWIVWIGLPFDSSNCSFFAQCARA